MKRFLTICIISTSLLFIIGCKSMNNAQKADSNMKRIELGMSKKQVINIMGDTYKALATREDGGVIYEAIGYDTYDVNWMYVLSFVNGKLKSWQREWVGIRYPPSKE